MLLNLFDDLVKAIFNSNNKTVTEDNNKTVTEDDNKIVIEYNNFDDDNSNDSDNDDNDDNDKITVKEINDNFTKINETKSFEEQINLLREIDVSILSDYEI